MGMKLPFGAGPIMAARQRGQRPADMVLVSFVGPLPQEANPVVLAPCGTRYDWSWARDIVLCFWATPDAYDAQHVKDAAAAKPRTMYLWDCANEKGYDIHVFPTAESIYRPRGQWWWHVDVLRWMPFQERAFSRGEYQWT